MDRRSLAALVGSTLRAGADLHGDLAQSCSEPLLDAAFVVASALEHGGKVLTFGNGGSAADAQHLAAEFVGRFLQDRRPLPAIALTTDSSALTAIANDFGYEHVFSRQVRALASSNDVVIGFSTSGRSPNVLAGLQAATELGATTVVFTGGTTNPASDLANISIGVPSDYTPQIQECHLVLEHLLCKCVEILLGYSSGGDEGTRSARRVATSNRTAPQDKVVDADSLLRERELWTTEGKTVVWTNGCFDLVHAGHVESLFHASELGDVLVVGINDDESVRRLKGPPRPILPASDRAVIIAAFACVDRVIIFPDDTPERILRELKPEVHCKGEEYAPPDGKPIPEAAVVSSYGGRVEFLPNVDGRSTSSLVEKVASTSRVASPAER